LSLGQQAAAAGLPLAVLSQQELQESDFFIWAHETTRKETEASTSVRKRVIREWLGVIPDAYLLEW
jgi:hypothetical protein